MILRPGLDSLDARTRELDQKEPGNLI